MEDSGYLKDVFALWPEIRKISLLKDSAIYLEKLQGGISPASRRRQGPFWGKLTTTVSPKISGFFRAQEGPYQWPRAKLSLFEAS
jgi:hypothetical protein